MKAKHFFFYFRHPAGSPQCIWCEDHHVGLAHSLLKAVRCSWPFPLIAYQAIPVEFLQHKATMVLI